MAKKVGKLTMQNVWDRFVADSKLPNRYEMGTWGWKNGNGQILGDCVCQIKKVGWGVDDNITYQNRYDYIAMNKDTMPDVSINYFYNKAGNKSTDMSKIPQDKLSFVYTAPIGEHIGIYNPKTNTTFEMCAGSIMGIREMKLDTKYWNGGWSTDSPYFYDSEVSKKPTPTSKDIKPIYNNVDYSAVYDSNYYLTHHEDLKKAFGNDYQKAFDHFIQFGMNERRQAKATFNVNVYKANYEDLRKAFGNDYPKYYKHYCLYGQDEGRNATTSIVKKPTYQCTYTVKKGDSLWAISTKYLGRGSRYKEIMKLNELKSDVLSVGQKLKIPNK